MKATSLEEGLREARVLVCAGTGGVGKTTIAAALAIQAALLGRRTLVLTIDPARRLADALGLETLGSKPTPVDLETARVEASTAAASVAAARAATNGNLDAMMLDAKPTFDRLISRLARTEAERRRILDNRIYEHLSSALAGSAEYAAMEQVHELVHSGRYDLIVVDTPPADHALDFLRAPRRLREFLESRFVHTLVRPAMSASRIGLRLFARPLHRMLGLLERIAGVGFLDDLSEFLSAIDGLSEGFRERATRVEKVLLGDETGFVLIAGANSGATTGAIDFMSKLEKFRVPLIAVIVNRLHAWPMSLSPAEQLAAYTSDAIARDEERLVKIWSESTDFDSEPQNAATLISTIREYAQICQGEHQTLEILASHAARAQVPCQSIPELSGNVDRLEGLAQIGRLLLADSSRIDPIEPSIPLKRKVALEQ